MRPPKVFFAAIALGGTAAGLLLFFADFGSTKVLFGFLGAASCVIGAFLSGNPRLFCLWCLMLTIPFDLSKRFGPIIEKMGGETSFRIEMSDPFLFALFVFLARDIWNGDRRGLRVPKITFVWIVIMMFGGVAVVFGPWRTTAAQELVRMFKLTVLFLVISNELERPNRMLHGAAGLAFAVIVQSTIGLIQYFTQKHLGLDLLGETGAGTLEQLASDSVRTEAAFRVGAFLSHPNIFGIFLAALLPMAIGAFLLRIRKRYKLLFVVASLLGMAALIGTLSRSGWISFGAAFVLLILLTILHPGLRRRSILTATVAAVGLLTVCVIFVRPIVSRIFESKESAMLSRAEYIDDASGMIRAKPIFGWGLNSYAFAAPPFTRYGAKGARERYKNWLPPVHNIYYLWTAETGFAGLLIHLALLGAIIWIGIRNLRVNNEALFIINVACLCGMTAFLVDGFFSFSLRINQILRLFWVQSGMIMAVHYWRQQHSGEPPARLIP